MRARTGPITASVLLSVAIVVLGCAVGGTSGAGTTTRYRFPATPLPLPHALAWFQQDGAGVGQVWASVNDGAAHQVTHMAAPSGKCVRDEHWSPPIFSPDLAHIVAGWGSANCGDGPEAGDLYVIDAGSGAATLVNGPSHAGNILLSVRQAGWITNTTLWWTDGSAVYTYALGAAHGTAVSAIGSSGGSSYTYAPDAVLRGNTLFFVTVTGTSGVLSRTFALRRFDMTTYAVLAGSVNLGSDHICECSLGDRTEPGFDVSPDGTHIVYQKVTASGSDSGEGIASSKFYYANADGSGASQIASYATAHTFTRMQISPDGRLVSIARAFPSPSVLTASVSSPGASGDPDLHFYNPDGSAYAVWDWKGTHLWTGTADVSGGGGATVETYTLGTAAGSLAYSNANNPWYTIGQPIPL